MLRHWRKAFGGLPKSRDDLEGDVLRHLDGVAFAVCALEVEPQRVVESVRGKHPRELHTQSLKLGLLVVL